MEVWLHGVIVLLVVIQLLSKIRSLYAKKYANHHFLLLYWKLMMWPLLGAMQIMDTVFIAI
jgi:hypothetical protein